MVQAVQGELSAHLLKTRLESEGIPVMLHQETYFDLYLSAHAPVSVTVPNKYAGAAKKIAGENKFHLLPTMSKRNLWVFTVLYFLFKLLIG
ncbi:MAG: DUF2007 domain-containing protein [Dehalococcoidales bacterium]|nr:DUF2007 domain-containing protein [Dehalococcoidales bacterium]